MTRENSTSADETAVRSVIDAITNAVRAKDVEAMLAHCAPDIATFDMVPPLKHEGAEAIRRLWATTLATFDPPLEYDVHHLELMVGGDLAISRSLNRFGGTGTDGTRNVSWLCSTLGLRKLDGRWKVVHEHVSVPFDMETGRAMLDLKP
jgi:uncharacterized protein (TIGR02246 family)